MKTPVLLPAPKSVFFSGCFTDVSSGIRLPEGILSEPSESAALGSFFRRDGRELSAEFSRSIGKESYILDVGEEKISVTYADTAGCFYALVTLRQMAEQGEGMIPCGKISEHSAGLSAYLQVNASQHHDPHKGQPIQSCPYKIFPQPLPESFKGIDTVFCVYHGKYGMIPLFDYRRWEKAC